MKVAHAIGEALGEIGVDHVFGLLGSGNLEVTNALVASGAKFIAARHETGAVTMADAYARVSRRLGVCTVHQGPGLTNVMTGLAEAGKREPQTGCPCRVWVVLGRLKVALFGALAKTTFRHEVSHDDRDGDPAKQ